MKLSPRLKTLISITFSSVIVWFLLPADLELARKIPAFFATVSMIAMAGAMLLSCRPKWIESLVGGMDRAYIWHKWLGIFGLVGASFHWLLVPGPAGNGIDPSFAEFGEELGQWAMYGLLLLGSVSMVKAMPYRLWYYTHKLMGPIFLIAVYHTFFSDVPFVIDSVTGISLVIVSLVGSLSWIYKTFIKPTTYQDYFVTHVEKLDGALEITLNTDGKGIHYHAGQFAYLDFGYDKVEHFHPFTIASAPHEKELKFVIRCLGRHTSELYSRVKTGDKVKIDGAYGRLHAEKDSTKPQIWIAGGVGITPFLSWLQTVKPSHQPIHLFYVGKGKFYSQIIKKLSESVASKNVTLHTQADFDGRLNAQVITELVETPVKNHQFFACGPEQMMKDLKEQLISNGICPTQWHNENFSMR